MPARDLFDAARRALSARNSELHSAYAELVAAGADREPAENEYGWDYSPEAKDLFPRYNVVGAVIVAIERLDPASLPDTEQLRRQLIEISSSATSAFADPSDQAERAAIDDERRRMAALIQELRPETSERGMPYHRVLSEAESNKLWARIRERWDLRDEDYWYPLAGDAPPDAEAYEVPWDEQEDLVEEIRAVVAGLGHDRVFQLTSERVEGGGGPWDAEYETDVEEWWPLYDGSETYSVDPELRWLLYASHESTLTVCGRALLDAVRTHVPRLRRIEPDNPRLGSSD